MISGLPPAFSATVTEGSKCKKVNSVTKAGSNSFVYLKSGKNFILVTKFKKCADVNAAGRTPSVREVEPLLYEANSGLDRDKDGIACDS